MKLKKNKKYYSISQIFIVVLMLLGVSCCHSSMPEFYNCPVYPVGGTNVGKELASISAEDYPFLWEWIGRINKLRQELELCRLEQENFSAK